MESELPATPQQVLDRILSALRIGPPDAQLAALHELTALSYSSAAILKAIEKLLLSDPGEELRAAAQTAIDSPANRFIRRQASRLSSSQRELILDEIERWETDGLVSPAQAEVLESRYDFDQVALPAKAPAAAAFLTGKAASDAAAAPAAAGHVAPGSPAAKTPEPAVRPTLTQTLLSETSIRIALYLGAFLVIAAAAILAALVAAARLPILGAVTAAFAAGSALTRRRLPQPSFVLFIVFSCLLPFDAIVLEDMLKLKGSAADLYWAGVYLGLVFIWVFATWFFSSRFFSIAAFVALDVSLVFLLSYLDPEPEIGIMLAALAGLAGLGGVALLQRLKDARFSGPLFISVLIHVLLVVLILVVANLVRSQDRSPAGYFPFVWWIASLDWVLLSAFFFLSGRLKPFPWGLRRGTFDLAQLSAWGTALALLPLPWTVLYYYYPGALGFIIGLAAWGALFAALSEYLRPVRDRWRSELRLALLTGSFLLFLAAWVWAGVERLEYELGVAIWVTLVFGLLSWRKPLRVVIWSITLLAALAAFLIFFQLPSMQRLHITTAYAIAAAALLLFLPDLFLKPDLAADRALRWPMRVLAMALGFLTLVLMLGQETFTAGETAVILLLFALLGLAYSLRYRKAWMPYLFTVLLASAVLETLYNFHVANWLPYAIGLAAAYFVAGVFLGELLAAPLRWSGLALGIVAVLFAAVDRDIPGTGWYSLFLAALFAFEVYRFRQGWAEPGIYIFASFAWWLILLQLKVPSAAGYVFTGISVLWILLPLLVERTFHGPRPLRRPVTGLSIVISITSSLYLLVATDRVAAICFSVLTVVFLLNALLRRSPLLGYSAAAALPLAVLFLLRSLDVHTWLFPLILIAILYYGAGFVLRRRLPGPSIDRAWAGMLVNSGLALGTVVALSAPLENSGLQAAIPVALAALLWTAEAFERRSVWLGFPSNALYLMSYFMILSALEVDQPQFYSVGAAALGLLMHYLLSRAGHRSAAFLTGLLSQLVLLSTTYYQMLTTERLGFFAVLFFQGLAVLAYGIVIRSRSLVITPIVFVVLGVVTVIYSALKGISTVILIGCTGILLLLLGIFAVVLRERFTRIGDRFSSWQA
jgi:hypothetical protein